MPTTPAFSPDWLLVKLYADLVDDLEKARIAAENRLRSLRDVKGLGGSPEEQRLAGMVKDLKRIENVGVRDLERTVAAHPLGPWVEQNHGIGLKTAGRLLGCIGDPTWYMDGETGEVVQRTVSKLWAYCGLAVDGEGRAQRQRKGEQSNFNSQARMRVYILSKLCMQDRESPFRHFYDEARAKYADRDTSDGHKHNMALRIVGKEILKSMWRFRRDHSSSDTQQSRVAPEVST